MKKVKKNVEMKKKKNVLSEKYNFENREAKDEKCIFNHPFYFEKRIFLNTSNSAYLQIGYKADALKNEKFTRLIRLVGKKFSIDFNRMQFGDFIHKIKSINGLDVKENNPFHDHILTFDRSNLYKTSNYVEVEESNYPGTFKISTEGKFLFVGRVTLQSILDFERYIFDVFDNLPEEEIMKNMLQEVMEYINLGLMHNNWGHLEETINTKIREMYIETNEQLKQEFIGASLSHFYDFIFGCFEGDMSGIK